MLKLNVNEEKQLNFEIQIGGVQTDQIKSTLRLEIDGVQYGFPAQVGQESIAVNLPALNTVVAKRLKEGTEVQASLDIIADGHHLTPWTDSFILTNPLVIEAKIVDVGFKDAPAFKTKMITSGSTGDRKQGVQIQKELVEEDAKPSYNEDALTDKIAQKLAEKLSLREQAKEEMPEEEEKEEKDEKKEEKKEEVKEEKEVDEFLKNGAMEKILSQTLERLGLHTEDSKTAKKKTEITLDEFKKNLTKEDIFKYMDRAGTKNPKVQEIVYEQAVLAAKNSTPVEVLRQVIKLTKKQKS